MLTSQMYIGTNIDDRPHHRIIESQSTLRIINKHAVRWQLVSQPAAYPGSGRGLPIKMGCEEVMYLWLAVLMLRGAFSTNTFSEQQHCARLHHWLVQLQLAQMCQPSLTLDVSVPSQEGKEEGPVMIPLQTIHFESTAIAKG